MGNRNRKKTASVEVVESVEKELYENVRSILAKARATVYVAANAEMVKAYWNVGREIVEKQGGGGRSVYGDGLVDRLAIKLTAEFGPGYTRVNLFYMRRFYLAFPKVHTLCKQLSWSHYRTLITVENEDARQYYFEEAIKSKWSVRVLQRQIATQFYQRLIANAYQENGELEKEITDAWMPRTSSAALRFWSLPVFQHLTTARRICSALSSSILENS